MYKTHVFGDFIPETLGCRPNPPGDFIPSPLLRFAAASSRYAGADIIRLRE